MTTTAQLLLAVAAAAAVVDWVAVARDNRRVEYVAKPLTMAALVAMTLALDPTDQARWAWFIAAGVFSLAGDVFLMLPRDLFIAGLVAFLFGHLCYIAGLVQGPLDGGWALIGLVVVAAAVLLVARKILAAVRSGDQASLFGPVVGYMTVICAMVVAAFAAGPVLAIAGAVLFFSSDATLAWQRFVAPLPSGRVAVMVTYHLGQTLLLLSVAQP
jgi:uncharacterized membrane protein YhhN